MRSQPHEMFSAALWNAYCRFQGMSKWWSDLDSFQEITPAEARAELSKRLLAQIRYFGTRDDALLEWREASRVRNSDELWRIWPDLPILSKQDLQKRFVPHEIKRRFDIKGIITSTGGSTGEPTWFLHDTNMQLASKATNVYCRLKVGWRPGLPTIIVWGSERDIGKQQAISRRALLRLANLLLIDAYELTSETVDRVLDLVRKHPAVGIYGFSSMLEFIARETLARGDLPPVGRVAAAWNGGEMLYESQCESFRNAFGIPILNYYGARELSSMAYQPKAGSSLKALRPLLFLEIVDQHGKPVGPGETGRLIWTNTACRGTPFVRFDVGDVGCYDAGDCDESGIRAIKQLQGRFAGLLKLPNGKTINCIFWNHILKEYAEVEQFQIVLKNDREILFRLKGNPFSPERELELRQRLRILLSDIPVSISWVEKIPLTPQGKLVQVVRE
jgi:phenylacetate-coenzyme A ligase PaaK-like adenylate-forming protein